VSERQQTRALLTEPWPGGPPLDSELVASMRRFLQLDVADPYRREDEGLQAIFRSIFPIKDFNDTAELTFVSYSVDPPRLTPEECRRRGETYGHPLKVTVQLLIWEVNPETGERMIRDVKEQEVYFGELPALSPEGSFIVFGYDRVLVRQLADSPGLRFTTEEVVSGIFKLRASITPHRGSRLALGFDKKFLLYAQVDGKKKFPATTLLRAMGLSSEAMLARLCVVETLHLTPDGKLWLAFNPDTMAGRRAWADVRVGGEVIVKKNRKFLKVSLRKLRELKVDRLQIDEWSLMYFHLAEDVVDQKSGEVLGEVGHPVYEHHLAGYRRQGVTQLRVVFADGVNASRALIDTLLVDHNQTRDDALLDIYRRLRPGDAPTVETAHYLFNNLFFSPDRMNLTRAGRHSLRRKLYAHDDDAPDSMCLTLDDILRTVDELLKRDMGRMRFGSDDVEHTYEAVVRDAGALLGDAIFFGLFRMERAIKERMSMAQEIDTLMPHDLINARPVSRTIEEFMGFSRVSERVDWVNPLAELSQRRRLSVSEPSRGTAKRTGYTVRGQHDSHLGRFCPVERPRYGGVAPALALSLSDFGGLVTSCQPLDEQHEPDWRPPAPWEMLGLGASLVPFLNHDDPEAAAVGIDSLRSAIPPLRPEVALVATGVEAEVAHASGLSVVARAPGVVTRVSGREVVVQGDEGDERYPLRVFEVAPRGALVLQRPVVRVGQRVAPKDLLATGPGVTAGELAVGHNLLTALVSGPTFGESLVVSERVVRDGLFAAVLLREYRATVSSAQGEEIFTDKIPGLDPEELAHLDERGLARVGSRVRGGDVLAGKILQQFAYSFSLDEDVVSPEDRSLRLPVGREGVVIEARIEGRRDAALPKKIQARVRVLVGELRPLEVGDLLGSRHGDRGTVARIAPIEDMPLLPDGRPVDLLLNPALILERGATGLLMELLAGAIGIPLLSPPFLGLDEARLRQLLGGDGSVLLRDGCTGEFFDQPSQVGHLYVVRLPPLVGDTFEARSTGPYDPLTELPTADATAHPGQLIDENDVSALLAHGAAYTLRELLAGKADSPSGREELLRLIKTADEPGEHVPQGLDALMRELQASALIIEALSPPASSPHSGEGQPATSRPEAAIFTESELVAGVSAAAAAVAAAEAAAAAAGQGPPRSRGKRKPAPSARK